MSAIIDAIIEMVPSKGVGTKNAYTYNVYIDGELINTHPEPAHTTCRILTKRGIDGEIRFWRRGKKNMTSGYGKYPLAQSSPFQKGSAPVRA